MTFHHANTKDVYKKLQAELAQRQVTLQHKGSDFQVTKSVTELGFAVDKQTIESWKLPREFYIPKPWQKPEPKQVPLHHANVSQLEAVLEPIRALSDYKAAVNPSFAYSDDDLTITAATPGWGYDATMITKQLQTKLGQTTKNVSLDIKLVTIGATVSAKELEKLRPEVEKILSQQYVLLADDKKTELTKEQVVSLLGAEKVQGKLELAIDASKTKVLVEQIVASYNKAAVTEVTSSYKSGRATAVTTKGVDGRQVNNIDKIVGALIKQLTDKQSYEGVFAFDATPFSKKSVTVDDIPRKRAITYSIITWGNVQADFNSFVTQVQETLNDARGWAAAGIEFQRVSSGGSFSVVLAEPARVAAASPICDNYYSCRVGRHVIINDERWRNATPAWTSSLHEYRHMVVSHETGHWLGRGHSNCSGPGQSAPVMQQQSISLQGCAPNPWPLAWELNAVRR